MATDPEINIQPDTNNPHTLEKEKEEVVELSPQILEQAQDHATSEFQKSRTDPLIRAAYVSQKLEKTYENGGLFMMAEIGPGGVNAVAVGDGERFYVDNIYDPEHVEEGLSPIKHIEETGYDDELGMSIACYETMDLDVIDMTSVQEAWGDKDSTQPLDTTYIVAPGMQESYQNALNQTM